MVTDIENKSLCLEDKVIFAYNNKLCKGTIKTLLDTDVVIKFQTRDAKGHFKTVVEQVQAKNVVKITATNDIITKETIVEKVIEIVEKIVYKNNEIKIVYKPTPKELLPHISL